jgi:hypothetical protein
MELHTLQEQKSAQLIKYFIVIPMVLGQLGLVIVDLRKLKIWRQSFLGVAPKTIGWVLVSPPISFEAVLAIPYRIVLLHSANSW